MKAVFGDISGVGSDCITVWVPRRVLEVADEHEADKIMRKEGYRAYVIPALIPEGTTLRIVGVKGFNPELNPYVAPKRLTREKHHEAN